MTENKEVTDITEELEDIYDGGVSKAKELLEKYKDKASLILGFSLSCLDMTEEEIRFFVSKGADVTANVFSSDGSDSPALHHVCEYRKNDLIPLMIKLGCDVNSKCPDGFTPLENAVLGHSGSFPLKDSEDTIRILLASGADKKLKEWILEQAKDSQEWDELSSWLKDFFNTVEVQKE